MNGNGNGDLNGGDFGMDIGGGFGTQAGGAVGAGGQIGAGPDRPGSDIPGSYDAGPSPSPDLTLDQAINLLQGAYPETPTPTPSAPSAPSTIDDLNKAFSPPSPPAPEEDAPITGTALGILREGLIDLPRGGLTKQGADLLAFAIDYTTGLLGVFFGLVTGLIASGVQGISKSTGTKESIGQRVAAEARAVTFPAVNVYGQAPSTKVASALVSGSSPKGSPVSLTRTGYADSKTEGLNQSLFSVPLFQKEPAPSGYSARGSIPLSMSLFGAKEGSGGLMIFPSSASGIEKEGSSLLKKQEPAFAGIDSTSFLFLMGMGLLGVVLRKGVKA